MRDEAIRRVAGRLEREIFHCEPSGSYNRFEKVYQG